MPILALMKRRGIGRIFSGAGVLAACSLLAKLMGALFRVPLTNIIGAEGMGLYQIVFPLYTVLLTATSGGLSGAISKLVASKTAGGDRKSVRKILPVSLLCVGLISVIAMGLLLIFRQNIAAMQGNPKAALSYAAIAPAIVLVSLICCLKGYFQGLNNMLFSGVSQLIEQGIKLFLGLFLAARLLRYGVEYAAFGALLGVTASEFCALIFLSVSYLFLHLRRRNHEILSRKRFSKLLNTEAALEVGTEYFYAPESTYKRGGQVLKSLYKIALPITLGSLIMPLTSVIDSVMVINMLVFKGALRAEATSLFGLVSGPISSLINMPLVITLAFSVAILPSIAANSDKKQEITQKGLKNVLIFSLPAAAVFFVFSHEVIALLYSGGLSDAEVSLCSLLLKIESFSIIFVSLIQVSTSVLQGSDKAAKPAINLLFGAVAKVILTLILLPILGIIGAAIASLACYVLTAVLDLAALKKAVGRVSLRPLFLPLIGSIILTASAYFSFALLKKSLNNILALLIAFLLGGAIYLALLLATKTLKIRELF